VKQGGGLLVSYSASLFDSIGKRTDRFALEELIKVRPLELTGPLKEVAESYTAMVGGPNDLYLMVNSKRNGYFGEWSERLVPLWYYEPVELLEGGNRMADIVSGDNRKPVLPGIVLSKYGEGRVAYLASTLESLFLGSNIRELADLITTLVRWVSPEPAPFELQGPDGLIANLTMQGNTRVVHLTNWTGNKFERRWVSEYYIAPALNVLLSLPIPQGSVVSSVTPLVEGSIQVSMHEGSVEVSIRRIDAYQAIAVTIDEASQPGLVDSSSE